MRRGCSGADRESGMNDHSGYQWRIEERHGEWAWTIRSRDDGTPLVAGAAQSRAHAAACVVRALVRGVTMEQRPPQSLAA